MKIYVAPGPGEEGKFQAVVRAFPDAWRGRVLDVGCRSRRLKEFLPASVTGYCGVDLATPAEIIADLSAGLPIDDRAYDTVVALDVLEHTDDIHSSIREVCRVAASSVIIALPNLCDLLPRMRMFLGRTPDKYGLPPDPVVDRHRWLFNFDQARAFTREWAPRCGYEMIGEGGLIGPKRAIWPGRILAAWLPNLLAPVYLAHLRRR